MKAVVALAVIVFISKAITDREDVVRRHSDIAEVVQSMKITAKQEAIADPVLATLAIWFDMDSLECWHGMLVCDRAGPFIRVPYGQTEESLAQSWPNRDWFTVTFRRLKHQGLCTVVLCGKETVVDHEVVKHRLECI